MGGLTVQLRAGRDAVGVGGRDHSSCLVGDGHEIIVDLLQVYFRHRDQWLDAFKAGLSRGCSVDLEASPSRGCGQGGNCGGAQKCVNGGARLLQRQWAHFGGG